MNLTQPERESKKFGSQRSHLLSNYSVYIFVNAGIGIFLNLYLWVNSLNIFDIIVYQFYSALTVMPGFLIMLGYASRIRNVDVFRFGIALNILLVITIIYLAQRSAQYAWLLGIESGLATGFYYAGLNSLSYQKIKQNDRISFNSWRNLLSNIMSILAPILIGIVIVTFHGNLGYIVAYISLLVLLGYVLMTSFRISGSGYSRKLNALKSFGVALANKRYPYVAGADVFWSMTWIIRAVILTVFVYLISHSALIVSIFWASIAASQTVASFFVRRYVHGKLVHLTGISNAFNIIGIILILIYHTISYLFIFAVIYGVFLSLTSVAYSTAAMDIIDTDPDPVNNQYHYIIMREYVLLFARLAGIGITFYIFMNFPLLFAMYTLLIFSAVLGVLTWLLIMGFYRTLDSPAIAPEPKAKSNE